MVHWATPATVGIPEGIHSFPNVAGNINDIERAFREVDTAGEIQEPGKAHQGLVWSGKCASFAESRTSVLL
jgi:hypothetical protein